MICHKSIEIIFEILYTVEIYPGYSSVIKQPFLIIHMIFMEHGNGIICADASLLNRQTGIYDLMHPALYLINKFLCQLSTALHCKIIPASH